MPGRQDLGADVEDQARAGADGFADAVTLGTADYAGALTGAVFGRGTGATFMDRYRSLLAANKAQDAYDAQHFPIARDAGLTAGTGLLVVASDGVAAPAAAARLAPQAIRSEGSMVSPIMQRARLTGAASGAGAGVGLLGQFAASLAQDKPSTAPEWAGAVAGGAVAGPTTLFMGPGRGAFMDAFVNHATQSALQGKPLDWNAVQQDTAVGAALGFVGGKAASDVTNGWPAVKKGDVGEQLSKIKSKVLGDNIIGAKKTFQKGFTTRADLILQGATPDTPRGVEAKFGFNPTLSGPQKKALDVLGPLSRYYVDHWLPPDVAKGIGGLLGIQGSQVSSNRGSPK